MLQVSTGEGRRGKPALYSTHHIAECVGGHVDFITTETGAKTGLHLFGGPNVNYFAPKKVSTRTTIHGPLDYAGVSDLYFASIFLPKNPDGGLMVTMHHAMDFAKNGKKPVDAKKAKVPVLGAAVSEQFASGQWSKMRKDRSPAASSKSLIISGLFGCGGRI